MKIFKYILPLAAMPLLFVSCSPEEDDLFEASAIERLEADAATTMDILCSAENGWEMLYFLNDEQDIPCYTPCLSSSHAVSRKAWTAWHSSLPTQM